MKKLLVCMLVLLMVTGCAEEGSSSSVPAEPQETEKDPSLAEDFKDLADEFVDLGGELADTFGETLGDLFSDTSSEEDETEDVTETEEETEQETAEEEEIVYIVTTVDEMYDVLDDNALRAKKLYYDQYVEVTGILGTIDSNGNYICLDKIKDKYSFQSVQCSVKNEEQLDHVIEMSSGKKYTVRIRITLVGELLGFVGDIVEFVD